MEKLKKIFEKYVTIELFISFIGVMSIFPFSVLFFYNHPSSDDIYYSYIIRDYGFWKGQTYFYHNINTRFVTNFLMMINPMAFGHNILGYQVMGFIIYSSFILSVFFLFKILFQAPLKMNFVFLSLFLILLLAYIPSPVEIFYWLSAAVCYLIANTILIIVIILCFKYEDKENKKYYILLLLLSAIIAGLNEVTSLLTIGTFIVFSVYKSFMKNKFQLSFTYVLPSLIIIFILSTAFYANSTKLRSNESILNGNSPNDMLFAIKMSFSSYAQMLWDFFSSRSLLIISTIFIYITNKYEFKDYIKINPIKIFSIIQIVLPLALIPYFYGLGYEFIYPRVKNTIYIFLTISWFGTLFFGVHYYNSQKLNLEISNIYIRILIIFVLLSLNFDTKIKTAIGDIIHKRASEYSFEMDKRYVKLLDSRGQDCITPSIKYHPTTIFIEDMRDDPRFWINNVYAKYYNLKSVKLQTDTAK